MSPHIKISVCLLNIPDVGLHSGPTELNINSRAHTSPLSGVAPGLMGLSDQFLSNFGIFCIKIVTFNYSFNS